MVELDKVVSLLRKSGVTGKYLGSKYTIMAMKLVLTDEDVLLNLSENIYQVIAKQENCKPTAVRDRIQKVADLVWKSKCLDEIVKEPLHTAPSNLKFLEILLRYAANHRIDN